MPLVEGLGDEVTIILGLLTIIIVVLIAWLSTHTRHIPFFSVIVVELSQRAGRNQQASQSPTQETPQQQSIEQNVETTSSPPVETLTAQQRDNDSILSPTVKDNTVIDSNSGDDNQSTPPVNSSENNESETSLPGEISVDTVTESPVSNVSQGSITSSAEAGLATNSTPQPKQSDISSSGTSPSDKTCEAASAVNVVPDNISKTVPPVTTAQDNVSETGVPSCSQTLPSVDSTNVRHRNVPSSDQSSSTPTTSQDSTATEDFLDDHIGRIRIRLKYLNDTQRLVYSSPTETIGHFKRTHFSSELEANKLVRLIFNGQDMRNDTHTLQGYNITDNSVIHCLVTQNLQNTVQPHTDHGDGDAQLGTFMMPLFAIILTAVWYLRFTQRQYFNAISTLSLAGITFLFLLGCASVWRNGAHREHQHVE